MKKIFRKITNVVDESLIYPVRNNAPLLCSGVRF